LALARGGSEASLPAKVAWSAWHWERRASGAIVSDLAHSSHRVKRRFRVRARARAVVASKAQPGRRCETLGSAMLAWVAGNTVLLADVGLVCSRRAGILCRVRCSGRALVAHRTLVSRVLSGPLETEVASRAGLAACLIAVWLIGASCASARSHTPSGAVLSGTAGGACRLGHERAQGAVEASSAEAFLGR